MDHEAPPQQRNAIAKATAISLPLLLLMLGIGVRINRIHRFSIFGTGQRTGIWNLSVSKFFLLLAVLTGIAWLVLKPRQRLLRFDTAARFLTAFIIWQALSMHWALYPGEVISQVLKIAFYLAIHALVVIYTRTWSDVRKWGYLFIFMSLGFLASGLHESIVGFKEMAATLDNSFLGVLGRWTVLLLPFNLHFLTWPRNKLERKAGALGMLANFGTLFLIVRRTPFIALPIQLLAYLLLIGKRKRLFVAIFLLLCITLPIVLLAMPQFVERVQYALEPLSPQNQDLWEQRQRFVLLLAGVQAVSEHWLFGMGAGGFMQWIHDVYGYRQPFAQHNVTLGIWSELGLIGVLLYGGFLLAAFRRMWQVTSTLIERQQLEKASLVAATICSLIGVVIYAQFQPIMNESLLYLVSGVGCGAYAAFAAGEDDAQGDEQAENSATN